MSGAPPIDKCAGAATSPTRDQAGAGGRGRNGCGAGGAGLRGALAGRGSAWGSCRREGGTGDGGARWWVLTARRRRSSRGSSASFRPRSSREGFLKEEEAFSATFLLPRGLAVMGNHRGTFRRGFFRLLVSFCSLGCLELGVILLPQHCQVLGS